MMFFKMQMQATALFCNVQSIIISRQANGRIFLFLFILAEEGFFIPTDHAEKLQAVPDQI